jgi:hypothetical protein
MAKEVLHLWDLAMARIVFVLAILAAVGLAAYVYVSGRPLQSLLPGSSPGSVVAPDAAVVPPLPVAKLDAKAVMVAGKRIELAAQWTSDQGPIYLESVTAYYLKDDGEVVREIPFEVRDLRAGFDFTRRFPLEPEAQLFGVCAVYAAAKDGVRVRVSSLFMNKGEGEASPMLSAAPPSADKTGGCFPY